MKDQIAISRRNGFSFVSRAAGFVAEHRAKYGERWDLRRRIGGAFVLYLAVFVITIVVNVPLNDQIKAAGEPGQIADFAVVRERFHEAKWVG